MRRVTFSHGKRVTARQKLGSLAAGQPSYVICHRSAPCGLRSPHRSPSPITTHHQAPAHLRVAGKPTSGIVVTREYRVALRRITAPSSLLTCYASSSGSQHRILMLPAAIQLSSAINTLILIASQVCACIRLPCCARRQRLSVSNCQAACTCEYLVCVHESTRR